MAGSEKRVAVVGATGVVGQTIGKILSERDFPVGDYVPVATDASSGRKVETLGRSWPVRSVLDVNFGQIDVCFFTAGAKVSAALVPRALAAGCLVVDNTTAFRMDPDVPLVVPEINGSSVTMETRLVSCPNCTAINLVMTLAPLGRIAVIERVVVTSFQSVSGAGRDAVNELEAQSKAELSGQKATAEVFPKLIAFNCIPRVGNVLENGYTVEEQKIIEETRKILDMPGLAVVPTAVRVPVRVGHSLSVYVEMQTGAALDDLQAAWQEFNGVAYDDDLPTPRDIAGHDTVVVGRLRSDPTRSNAVTYWAVGDNLRKGAATNCVQIAELLAAS